MAKRVLLGKEGSNYVLKVSKPTVDVIDDTINDRDYLFNSEMYRAGVIRSNSTYTSMTTSGVDLPTTSDSSGNAYIPAFIISEKGAFYPQGSFDEVYGGSGFTGGSRTATFINCLNTAAGGGMFQFSLNASGTTKNKVIPYEADAEFMTDPRPGEGDGTYPFLAARSRASSDGDVKIQILGIPCQFGKMTNNATLFGTSVLTGSAVSGGGGSSGGGGTVSAPTITSVSRTARTNSIDTVSVNASAGTNNSGTITYAQSTTDSAFGVLTTFGTSSSFTQPRNSTRYYFAKQSNLISDTGGGGNTTHIYVSAAVDSTPNTFSFTPELSASLNSTNTSNTITIAGLGDGDTATVSLSGTAGSKQYSKNGGSYTSSSGTAQNGDTFTVRGTASASYASTVTVILTVGGVSGTYSISTQGVPVDTTPNPFSFTDVTGANASTVTTSNTINISGINAAATVTASGNGTVSVNGGSYTNSTTITNGQSINVRLTSNATLGTSNFVETTINIGGITDTWRVTNRNPVTASPPTALTLTQTTNTAASSQTVTATASGGSGTPQVSNDGSNWQSNGYSFSQSRTGTAVTYYARNTGEVNSSSITATKVVPPVVTLSGIGNFTGRSAAGENNTYNVNTQRAGGNYNTYASYWGTTTTSISNNSGGWLSSTITNSSLGYFNLTSQSNPSTSSRTATVTYTTSTQFGYSHTMTFTFQQNGQVADTTPNQFTFTDYSNATVNTTYNSSVTITGINTAVTAVYTGDANGSFSTDNSTFNQSNKTVNNGDTIYLRLPSAGTNSTARTATITIGSISDSMTVTTVAASDTTPNAFSFTDVTGADTLSIYSDTVTITGINTSVTATITTTDGAIFKVNNGTANTSSKTVVNNDTITVSIATTSDSFTLHQATITVGGVSDTFSVTTGSSGGFEP
jgi:hypothetical protein